MEKNNRKNNHIFDLALSFCNQPYHCQEAAILELSLSHEHSLADIASQLFRLQANLIAKEKYLGQVISDREQVSEEDKVGMRLWIMFFSFKSSLNSLK